MLSSQLFIAVTVAFGAMFIGTCIYFREDLGIPTEVFTGLPKSAPKETGPRCDAITIQTNATAFAITFICHGFEDLSIANDPTAVEKAKKSIIRVDQYGLNFTLETVNPTISETCAYMGPDSYEDCDYPTGCGAAGFIVRTHHDDRLYHGTRRLGVRFYFTAKDDKRKEASFRFQYTCDPIDCMLGKSCTLLREDTYRGYIIPRLWRVDRFNFEFTLTITDSVYS